MPEALFNIGAYRKLPLWAQVLVASRMARRAALMLPRDVPESERAAVLAGCEALDRCCQAGERLQGELAAIERARDLRASGAARVAAEVFRSAADAAHAAQDSLDLSAAEAACEGSVGRAIAAAGTAAGLNALQARILAASDVDVLGFNCGEFRVGRHDGVGREVMERLHPVHPPAERLEESPGPMDDDPTGGAR